MKNDAIKMFFICLKILQVIYENDAHLVLLLERIYLLCKKKILHLFAHVLQQIHLHVVLCQYRQLHLDLVLLDHKHKKERHFCSVQV